MKIATLTAALCITSSVAVILHVPVVPSSQPQPRGYTSGKDCYLANGCYLPAKFSQCLDCCMTHCPYPWNQGCVDECIARFDPKNVYGALLESTKTISEHRGGQEFGDAKTVLIAVQMSKDTRLAHVARILAVESEDYGGVSGIYQGTTR